MLPNDVSRCEGFGNDEEGWREGCEDCSRRKDVLPNKDYFWIKPPAIIVFWCEKHISNKSK